MTAEHKELVIADGLHSAISLAYADEAARLAAGPFNVGDLYKLAWQDSTSEIFILTVTSPATWSKVTATSGSGSVTLATKKNSPGSIAADQAVYAAGYDGVNNVVLVELAQANSVNTIPCIGVTLEVVDNVTGGLTRESGLVENYDTSSYSVGDTLFLSEATAGALRLNPPSGSNNQVQPIALVLTVGVSGSITIDRSNPRWLNSSAGLLQGLGVASGGAGAEAARSDHVHPALSNADHDFNGNNVGAIKVPWHTAKVGKGSVSGAVTIDWNQGRKQEMTLTGNITALTFTNPPGDSNLILIIKQDVTGNRTMAGFVGNHFIPGGSGVLSTTANALDRIYIEYDTDNNSYYWHEQLDYGSFTSMT